MPSSAASWVPLCLRIVGLCLPVLAHSWHNGGLVDRHSVAFVWADLPFRRGPLDPRACGAKGLEFLTPYCQDEAECLTRHDRPQIDPQRTLLGEQLSSQYFIQAAQ